MSDLLRRVLWLSISIFTIGETLHGKMPESPAGQIEKLPTGAVARFGESRFLNVGRVFSIEFSGDGKTLVAGSWDGTVRLYAVATGKELRQFENQLAPIRSVAISPDGKVVACGSESSNIVLWDAATGKHLRRLAGHKGPITFVAISPNGKLLVSKSYDQTLRLWDLASGNELRRLAGTANEPEFRAVFSIDSKMVASTCRTEDLSAGNYLQRTFRIWDVATGQEIKSFKGNRASLGVAAFSPDCKLLAIATGGTGEPRQRICLWEVASGRELLPIEQIENESVSFLAFSPDSRVLASSGGGPIQLWDVATRRQACRFEAQAPGRTSLAFSPDGRLLASGSTDTTFLVWDVTGRMESGKLRPAELTPEEMQTLWADLGNDDVPKSWQAMWAMVAAGAPSVRFMRENLHLAVSPASPEGIGRLVIELDSEQSSARKNAMAQLVQLAEFAEPNLLDAQKNHPSLELSQRIEEVLNKVVDQKFRLSGERLRMFRAIASLEHIHTPESRQLLETLARGAPGALLTREAQASIARLGQ
jgi:WD40 domain-containing protein